MRADYQTRVDVPAMTVSGTAQVVAAGVPPRAFFRAGRKLQLTLRHANAQATDSTAPTTLGLFTPAGPGDGNAIAWYRRAVYRRAQEVRAALAPGEMAATRGRTVAHRRRLREISRITTSRRAAPQNATKITPA